MGSGMKTSTVFYALFKIIFGSCAQFSLSRKAQDRHQNGVRVLYCDFPRRDSSKGAVSVACTAPLL